MKRKLLIVSFVAVCFSAAPALAGPGAAAFGDGGDELQGILNDITVGGDSSVDVTADAVAEIDDSYWSITSSGGSVGTLIIEVAGYAGTNKFGVFDYGDPTNFVELFDGAASAGDQVTLSIKVDGSVYVDGDDSGKDFAGNLFGYYLDATTGNNNDDAIFYSATQYNEDDVDHLFAYQGTDEDMVQLPGYFPGTWTDNEFILAWEDLYGGGDRDYSDFVLMVESVEPIPVPGAVLLGVLGLSAAGIRLRRFA